MSVIRELLVNAIDYAGLFPPAGLGMEDTVRKYASYRKGPDRWALGRLVVPVARLAEFESKAAPLLEAGEPWHLTVLGGPDLSADLKAIEAFHDRHLSDARIDSLEIKAGSPAEIRQAAETIGGRIETFYEIPPAGSSELIEAIHAAHGRAKVRTGGVKPGMVPSPEELGRFLCLARKKVAFKATAGLHHALRSVRPLTYETGCESDLMHGFLNVFIASGLAFTDQDRYVPSVLDERDIRGFVFGDRSASWHGNEVTREQIQVMRDQFLISFGSCSFEEPMAELKELKLG
jgi:hypothetical protein